MNKIDAILREAKGKILTRKDFDNYVKELKPLLIKMAEGIK